MTTFFKPYNLQNLIIILNISYNYLTVGFGFPKAEQVKFTVELRIASIFVVSFSIRGGTEEKELRINYFSKLT